MKRKSVRRMTPEEKLERIKELQEEITELKMDLEDVRGWVDGLRQKLSKAKRLLTCRDNEYKVLSDYTKDLAQMVWEMYARLPEGFGESSEALCKRDVRNYWKNRINEELDRIEIFYHTPSREIQEVNCD